MMVSPDDQLETTPALRLDVAQNTTLTRWWGHSRIDRLLFFRRFTCGVTIVALASFVKPPLLLFYHAPHEATSSPTALPSTRLGHRLRLAMPYRRQGIAEAEERLPSCLQHRHGKARQSRCRASAFCKGRESVHLKRRRHPGEPAGDGEGAWTRHPPSFSSFSRGLRPLRIASTKGFTHVPKQVKDGIGRPVPASPPFSLFSSFFEGAAPLEDRLDEGVQQKG